MVKVARVVESEEAPLTKDSQKTYVVAYHGLHLAIPWEFGWVGVVVDALCCQLLDVLAIAVGGTLIVWVGIRHVETIREVGTFAFEALVLILELRSDIPLFLSYFLDVPIRVLYFIRALLTHPLRCLFEGIHDVVSEVPELHLLDPCPPLP